MYMNATAYMPGDVFDSTILYWASSAQNTTERKYFLFFFIAYFVV